MLTITASAAKRLRALINQEADADKLGIRVHITTTSCNYVSYSIAITDPSPDEKVMVI